MEEAKVLLAVLPLLLNVFARKVKEVEKDFEF